MNPGNIYMVARARSVGHRCLFSAMGMRYRAQIGHVGIIGHKMAILKELGTRTPASLGDVAPVVAAVVTHETGVRHIYLIYESEFLS